MPNIKLTNLVAYKAYWADIAAKHNEVDGFKYGGKDVLKNDNRSDMPPRVLWAAPYEKARYGDKMSDNVHKTKTARVAYLKCADSESFIDIETTLDECETVIEQILAKIYQDKRGADVAGVWTMIVTDVSSWTTSPVEMLIGSTKYYGCELQINFMDNTNLAYDASKWDS